MRIAVCEDGRAERDGLREMLGFELIRHGIPADIVLFASGEAMLEAMGSETFPVNFLDIYMDRVTGVDIAREIRERDSDAAIVFTTSSRDHMANGFEVGAVHYLLKPFTQQAVGEALDRCLRAIGPVERFVEVTTNRETRKLLLPEIWWAESQDKGCALRLAGESLWIYMRLDALSALLADPRFLRCHKSFLVNLDHVAYVRGNDFVMIDGSLVPIRREDRARHKAHFEDYCFDKQRRGVRRS